MGAGRWGVHERRARGRCGWVRESRGRAGTWRAANRWGSRVSQTSVGRRQRSQGSLRVPRPFPSRRRQVPAPWGEEQGAADGQDPQHEADDVPRSAPEADGPQESGPSPANEVLDGLRRCDALRSVSLAQVCVVRPAADSEGVCWFTVSPSTVAVAAAATERRVGEGWCGWLRACWRS